MIGTSIISMISWLTADSSADWNFATLMTINDYSGFEGFLYSTLLSLALVLPIIVGNVILFATTWPLPGARRELPRLSDALGRAMPKGARVITVDARLCEEHGWRWEGELRVDNADVAPHSTAQLYTLRG